MAEKTKSLTKSDLLFLIALAERGVTSMCRYNEPGWEKAGPRLARVKRETASQED